MAESVSFDVLIAASGDAGEERVERVRQWLHANGASCHRIAAGLSCSIPAAGVGELFGVEPNPGDLPVPAPISDEVEAITVAPPPAYF